MRYVLILSLLLTACTKDAERVDTSSNAQFKIGKLFDHEGCTLYRFEDGGRYHYYANCPGGTTVDTIDTIESCGKNCTYNETLRTNKPAGRECK